MTAGKRCFFPIALLLAALIAASGASADSVVVRDSGAQQIAALDGTIVWVTGQLSNQSLRMRTARGSARVPGTPRAYDYDWIDLGRDRRGDLVLSYVTCTRYQLTSGCIAHRDDLHGHNSRLTGLALRGCRVNTPAIWGTRIAYNLDCESGSGSRRRQDPGRSGLYVKTATAAPKRLVQPRSGGFEASEDYEVDLRGSRVAAITTGDVGVFGFSESVTGRGMRSFVAARSLNRPDGLQENAPGLALGPGGAMWTLKVTTSPHAPDRAVLSRSHGRCTTSERLRHGPGRNVGPSIGGQLAVDGRRIYLLKQGTGILAHHFKPDGGCR